MPQKTQAAVMHSLLEHRVDFAEPILAKWDPQGSLAPALIGAFRPWNLSLENVSWKSLPNNAAEIEIKFDLMPGKMAFHVALGNARLWVQSPTRSETQLYADVAEAGVGALRASVAAIIQTHTASLSQHVQPTGASILGLTSKFVQWKTQTESASVRCYGFSVYRDDGFYVVDASAAFKDSLFIRIARTFPGDTAFLAMADRIYEDEDRVLDELQLELA